MHEITVKVFQHFGYKRKLPTDCLLVCLFALLFRLLFEARGVGGREGGGGAAETDRLTDSNRDN